MLSETQFFVPCRQNRYLCQFLLTLTRCFDQNLQYIDCEMNVVKHFAEQVESSVHIIII